MEYHPENTGVPWREYFDIVDLVVLILGFAAGIVVGVLMGMAF